MVELLVPAGNMEMLYQAVCNGADAVYLGGKHFGARAYSLNFSNDEMISAINYCHTYGVKVYVTVNTIIFESETSDFLEYVEFLYKNNVDAVIMQDIGMIDMVHKCFPNLEIHASTQCHNHNIENILTTMMKATEYIFKKAFPNTYKDYSWYYENRVDEE